MTEMFKSATIKLTAWYVLILVAICLIFSGSIYTSAAHEINARINGFGQDSHFRYIPGPTFDTFESLRERQLRAARANLVGSLALTNIIIWTLGGIGSYYLARRTLRPIEQAHEAQSRFTSDASHELRTPLTAMKTELEVALRDKNLPETEMRELLESNLEEVDKLTRLSKMLLELSRLDNKRIKKHSIKLNPIIEKVATRLDKSHRRIVVRLPKQAIRVVANQESLEELVTILLDNALKYSPDTTDVVMTLGRHDGKARITITNEGKGISAKDLPHIFDRFYRADDSRTNGPTGGYGLGLSLAKKIVELHNGDLTVSSTPGALTTFTVELR